MSAALRTGRPVGRPPIPYRLDCRFTAEQLDFIETMAERDGMSLAGFVRRCVADVMRRQQSTRLG